MSQVSELSDVLQGLLEQRTGLGGEREVLQKRGAYVDGLIDSLNEEDAQLKEREKSNAEQLRSVRRQLKVIQQEFHREQKEAAQQLAREAKELQKTLDQQDPLPDKQ